MGGRGTGLGACEKSQSQGTVRNLYTLRGLARSMARAALVSHKDARDIWWDGLGRGSHRVECDGSTNYCCPVSSAHTPHNALHVLLCLPVCGGGAKLRFVPRHPVLPGLFLACTTRTPAASRPAGWASRERLCTWLCGCGGSCSGSDDRMASSAYGGTVALEVLVSVCCSPRHHAGVRRVVHHARPRCGLGGDPRRGPVHCTSS